MAIHVAMARRLAALHCIGIGSGMVAVGNSFSIIIICYFKAMHCSIPRDRMGRH